MGTLASGSIDLKSLKVAGEGASKYITEISGDGIKVHDGVSTNPNYISITSAGMEVYQKTNNTTVNKVAEFKSYITLGTRAVGSPVVATSLVPGISSAAIGSGLIAQGSYSFASGYGTEAVGNYSHAEGATTFAVGSHSHSEGEATYAYGIGSHAGGRESKAGYKENNTLYGHYSFVHGDHVKATANYQTVFGKYNEEDSNAMFIIGNGTDNTYRSNLMVIGNDDIRIGNTDSSHLQMDYHSLRLIDKENDENSEYLYISDLRKKEDSYQATITETFQGDDTTVEFEVQLPVSAEISAVDGSNTSNTATRNGQTYTFASAPANNATITIVYKTVSRLAKAYTLGIRKADTLTGTMSFAEGSNITASGYASHAEGDETTASGYASHAEGAHTTASGFISHAENSHTVASGSHSHAEGYYTTATNFASHAEGNDTRAIGHYSHAEGAHTRANGISSHAEGYYTQAQGSYSHAEGSNTIATSSYSHAEGSNTIASNSCSHAEGRYTIAQRRSQVALGEYNKADTGTGGSGKGNYVVIVGNGTSDTARSNALTVDWNGGIQLYLDVDSSASSSTDATSGTDAGLFNNIRAMGWYSDVIS